MDSPAPTPLIFCLLVLPCWRLVSASLADDRTQASAVIEVRQQPEIGPAPPEPEFPDLEGPEVPPIYVESVHLSHRDFVTRARFSNGAEIWLAPSRLDAAQELEERMEKGIPLSDVEFASLVFSEHRATASQIGGRVRYAPPVYHHLRSL